MGSNPFSTGGGGTNFEQAFAATQLAALLVGESVPALGDDVRVGEIRFQAGPISDVDDLLLRSDRSDGTTRTAAVAARHNPTIASGDDDFVALLATMINTFAANRAACGTGDWRLGLVVAAPHPGATTLAPITDAARANPNTDDFDQAIQSSSTNIRQRFGWFSEAFDAAASHRRCTVDPAVLGQPGSAERSVFLHELLVALHVFQRDLDGDDAADRSAAIRSLAALTDGPAAATDVWNALVSTTAVVNPQAATMTEATLRRRLPDHQIRPGQRHTARLATLENLGRSLRSRVRTDLVQPAARGVAPPAPFELPREDALAALVNAANEAAGDALIVTGPADSGKSALTLRAATVLREGGAHVVVLHAADCAGVGTAADPFGGRLGDALGCATTARDRYLVIDGAETAAGDGALRPLIDAALAADYTPVIVARDDSADDVNSVLTDALISAGHTTVHDRHEVDPLTDQEIREVVDHFPALTSIAARPRAGDLLDKPGLVDTLLRARPAFDDAQAPLTELDVFDAFWTQIVRSPSTAASATGRDTAATVIARRILRHDQSSGHAPDAESVDALRSDGIIAPFSTFAGQDTFASDLYLDFATARVLVTDGLGVLIDAPSPRWALRATRLAVQGRLSAGGVTGAAEIDALRRELAAIAAEHGARWNQVLDEAILGHPNARELLTTAGPTLVADAQRLHDFLDTTTRLHVVDGAATPTSGRGRRSEDNPALDALAPVVDLLLDHENTVVGHGHALRDQSDALLLAFLRGAAWHGFPTRHADAVRRTAIAFSARGDDYRTRPPLEAFALLGPDLEAIGRPRLEAIAGEAPQELDAVIESRFSIRALLDHDPTLLAELSIAYYLEESESSGSLFTFHDDGVRGHSLHLGPPRIHGGPDRGPFLPLLMADPAQGLRVVHAVLERGAAVRQRHLSRLGSSMPRTAAEEHTERSITLQLGRLDPRGYVGDSQVWYWYRRSGVGQDSCISAAMALEMYADYLISAGTDPNAVVDLIMADARSLAECGVAFSVIVRNLPATGPRIAEWLRERMIWELETERVTHEYHAIARAGDDPELRQVPTNSLATKLVWDALASGDSEQLARLAETADALEAGVADLGEDDQQAAVVRLSAALLRPETYDLVERLDGTVMFVPRPPDTITQPLASGNRDLERVQHAIRLQMDWSPTSVHHPAPPPVLWRLGCPADQLIRRVAQSAVVPPSLPIPPARRRGPGGAPAAPEARGGTTWTAPSTGA